jgi:glycosyltransferase involved in cell wall biosynthesis
VSATWIDVTDLIEFFEREESVSGVQRVIARVAPLLLDAIPDAHAILLDRDRGRFVELTRAEQQALLPAVQLLPAAEIARVAGRAIERARSADPVDAQPGDVALFLGAVWIADAVMLAVRRLHADGVKCVYLLYDLTPVLQTGHTAAVNHLFDRYLELVLTTASRVPAISESSRRDFESFALSHGKPAPEGAATGLPAGLLPKGESTNPWSRPYVLFVGTIESRKQHALALEAWRRLLDRHADLPDLVCVGRLGWHAEDFLEPYVASRGLDGRVSVLSHSVSDEQLHDLYANCEFTVYPSSYEGWGLPVSESLAFGKVVITARNSSLTEAGGELASYFQTGQIDDFISVIERDGLDAHAACGTRGTHHK